MSVSFSCRSMLSPASYQEEHAAPATCFCLTCSKQIQMHIIANAYSSFLSASHIERIIMRMAARLLAGHNNYNNKIEQRKVDEEV